MSTRQVLGFAGAAIGGFLFGPTGAQWGFAIGSTIGGVVDPEVIKGPSIGDLAEQTSSEGGPRPIVYALSKPLAGNVIAQGEPRVVKKKKRQGKGGPKVETESVYRTYAVGVCEGQGDFVQVWRNGQLVYDILQGQLSDQDNANFLERARFFRGTFDQNPSPDLEALFGVGTTPAHRGTMYMVMADEDLTDLRGAIPQWIFRVQRCPAAQAVLMAIANTGGLAPTQQVMRSTDGQNFALVDTPENVLAIGGFGWQGIAHSASLGLTVVVAGSGTGGVPRMMVSEDNGATWELLELDSQLGADGGGFYAVARSESLGLFAAVRKSDSHAIATSPDGRNWTMRATPDFHGAQAIVFCEASGLFVAGQAGVSLQAIMTSPDGINWTIRATPASRFAYEIAVSGLRLLACGRDERLLLSTDGGVTWGLHPDTLAIGATDVAIDPSTGKTVLTSHHDLEVSGDGSDFDPVIGPPDGIWEGCVYSSTFGGFYMCNGVGSPNGFRIGNMPDGFFTVQAIATPALADDSNWGDMFVIEGGTAGECVFSLAEVVTDICARAGLPASLIDVTDLEAIDCRGFVVTNTYPAFTALRSLSEVFFFDPAPMDGKVHFVRRGANSVATIVEDDLLDDEQDIEQSRRPDAISIPRVLNLSYFDVAGGVAPDKQSSERAGDRRATGEMSLQSAVLMTANEAAQVVACNHKIMIEDQRGELKFEMSDEFIELTPTDAVIIQWQGRSVRARLTQVMTDDGSQQYRALHDRQSAYTSEVEGIPAAPQTPPPSSIVGPTLIQPLDIHILQDADDNVGLSYYVALSGIFEAWQGAQVELSFDGGANYVDSATTRDAAIMGELVTALPDHPQAFPDETNTVRVRIDTPLAELDAATLAALLSDDTNLAIVGDELVQFGEVDEAYEGVWDLSLLLRGRKGTSTATHAIGERFVLLDRATLSMITANLADIGRTLTFRATSFGTPVETGTVVSMVYAGRSQIEREPAYLMAHRSGSDAVVTWQGVGRLGQGISTAQGARFAGYRVTFDDGVLEESIDTADEELTHDVTGFASPLTIRVAQINDLTGAGPEIEVVLI